MINTLKPGSSQGHGETRGEVLDRIHKEYGMPEEKQREPVKKLGKDEFFKIMVTQIQHQDPLKPYQNEEMAAQMAQFSALEQMMNMNQNMEKMTMSQQPLHHLAATNLIGKHVIADSSHFAHVEGKASDITFDLPADASKVRVVILNERGENICELEKADFKKGSNKIAWDGKRSNNMPAKAGNYRAMISAEADTGKNIPVQTLNTQIVHGVAFEGNETVLLTGDVARPQKMLLSKVSKIVDASGAKPGGAPGLPDSIAELVKAQQAQSEVPTEGISVGEAAKYDPIDLPSMRKAQEQAQPIMSTEQLREMMENKAKDLSAANPVATAIKEGKPIPGSEGEEKPRIDSVNPAARARVAQGNSLPSSEDGSTAGKWAE